MDEVSHAIGQLQATTAATAEQVKSIDAKVDRLLAAHERQRGRASLLAMLGAGGGGVVGWIVTWWTSR